MIRTVDADERQNGPWWPYRLRTGVQAEPDTAGRKLAGEISSSRGWCERFRLMSCAPCRAGAT